MAYSRKFLIVLFVAVLAGFCVGTTLAAPGAGCKTKQCRDYVKIETRKKWRAEVKHSGYAGWLKRLRGCEARGWKNPYRAISDSGSYRGAYQFDARTWKSVGGHGHVSSLWNQPWADPAEQDVRAVRLRKKSGTNPWPVCG